MSSWLQEVPALSTPCLEEDFMKRVLALALLFAVIQFSGQSAAAQTSSRDTGVKAEAVITRLFGNGVEVARALTPYYFVGDFNGDANADLLAVVKLKAGRAGLPKGVKVLNPWGYEGEGSPGKSDLALIIVHGARGGWDVPSPSGSVYVL